MFSQVQVIFRSQAEVSIRDLPLLKCQVIEPSIGDGKEVIASIPIRLSVRLQLTSVKLDVDEWDGVQFKVEPCQTPVVLTPL